MVTGGDVGLSIAQVSLGDLNATWVLREQCVNYTVKPSLNDQDESPPMTPAPQPHTTANSAPRWVTPLLGEALGTGLLIVAVVGSGIMAEALSADPGIQLLANAGATVGALYALILMFAPISGAHFNPIVSLAAVGRRQLTPAKLLGYLVAQVVGGCIGTAVANLMFERPAWQWSTKVRDGGGVWLGEIVATAGLLLVIVLVSHSRATAVPAAVAAWIGGAYWFTSSTSLANPAVTVARSLSDSFAGIAPESVAMFMVMQVVGAAVGYVVLRGLGRWEGTP
jgi:glycerol uptake facilitator-like aquaporin